MESGTKNVGNLPLSLSAGITSQAEFYRAGMYYLPRAAAVSVTEGFPEVAGILRTASG